MNPSNGTGRAPVSVLVVDDHPNLAATLARAISQLGDGIEVIAAESGEKALQLTQDKNVDLLITDMVMPGITGLELIEKMQNHPGGRPSYVALVTAYDVPGLKETARRMHVNEVINKPIRPERLCQIVSKAIEDLGHAPVAVAQDGSPQMKILVVDDQPDNVTLLTRYLENEGYLCLTASNGEQALECLRRDMLDLVLLDVNMPVMDGFQALQEIRADPSIAHIPVIFITAARLEPMDLQYALSIGADDYVTKPFDRRELLARIRTRLRVKETEDIIRRRNKELNLLPEIGRELSARLDVNELIDLLLRRTVETLGALLGYMILLTPEGTVQGSFHFSPSGAHPSEIAPDTIAGLTAQINESRQGIIISDASKDSRWQLTPGDPARSLVIAPMFSRLGLLGFLLLVHEQPGYFILEHRLLLQAIASQAAIAMENARLYGGVIEEQQRMSAILNSVADAVFLFDAHSRLLLQNPAAGSLLAGLPGSPASPPLGIGFQAFDDLLQTACKTAQAHQAEILWPDQRLFSTRLVPMQDGGCLAIFNDISSFKSLEQEKDDFITQVFHNFKNLLGRIKLANSLLPQAGQCSQKQVEYIQAVAGTVDTMDQLIQELIQRLKPDSNGKLPALEQVSVNQLVSATVAEFKVQADENRLVLHFSADKNDPPFLCQPVLLQQAFRNLLSNALKYSPAGGTIFISVRSGQDGIVVCFKDNGYGISAADLPFIFDRFYRSSDETIRAIEGTGLGLAIVKSIVEQHGGQVNVESRYGQGSTFIVSLPAVAGQAPFVPGTVTDALASI